LERGGAWGNRPGPRARGVGPSRGYCRVVWADEDLRIGVGEGEVQGRRQIK
jgi:hypothetical protein